MADLAELGPGDEVLEIGPGLGILTRVLANRAQRVVAAELDSDLAAALPGLVPSERLCVLNHNALAIDPADHFSSEYKLVANLPYAITSPVLTRFLTEVRRPLVMVVMVQLEVAERIAARDGQETYLSNLVKSVADVRIGRQVAPGAFYPPPKVRSAVLVVRPLERPLVPMEEYSGFLQLVRAGFSQPRKTVANSLAQGLDVPRDVVERRLLAAGIDSPLRPHQISIVQWLTLLRTA